jgi:hypothetical protein
LLDTAPDHSSQPPTQKDEIHGDGQQAIHQPGCERSRD